MKMVKSFLLGSAAGLVAVSGAQAADLPVKAKPVEYVKVCSLYGAGYYYMPGSDICLKLGGYVRYQAMTNPGNNITSGPLNGTGGRNTRIDSADFGQRVRGVITTDTRSQTAYGTLRTYTLLGFSQDSMGSTGGETTSPPVYMTRGFIQVAGFTFGKASSFFDIYPNAAFGYNVGPMFVSDTGDAGKILATYTAQLGSGLSVSLGIEQSKRRPVVYLTASSGAFTAGTVPTSNALSSSQNATASGLPDIVGNIRMDQAWGSVLTAVALHNVAGGYWGTTTANGNPEDAWGHAVTVGAILNLPMIAPGDKFAFQFVHSVGAIGYAAQTPSTSVMVRYDSAATSANTSRVGFGFFTDGVYTTNGSVEKTTAWSVGAGFEHLWTPALRTSIYGSYIKVTHNAAAVALICANGGVFGTGGSAGGCNPDWSSWVLGSRTQWQPVRGWTMGVDVMYTKLNTATPSTGQSVATQGAQLATNLIGDQSAWVFSFRTQRDYHP